MRQEWLCKDQASVVEASALCAHVIQKLSPGICQAMRTAARESKGRRRMDFSLLGACGAVLDGLLPSVAERGSRSQR
jgi:hypothetical protein